MKPLCGQHGVPGCSVRCAAGLEGIPRAGRVGLRAHGAGVVGQTVGHGVQLQVEGGLLHGERLQGEGHRTHAVEIHQHPPPGVRMETTTTEEEICIYIYTLPVKQSRSSPCTQFHSLALREGTERWREVGGERETERQRRNTFILTADEAERLQCVCVCAVCAVCYVCVSVIDGYFPRLTQMGLAGPGQHRCEGPGIIGVQLKVPYRVTGFHQHGKPSDSYQHIQLYSGLTLLATPSFLGCYSYSKNPTILLLV